MALGVALVIMVLVVHGVVDSHFRNAAQGYHLIIGAKGGKLQLVLNTVYHLSQPIENIPYSMYQRFLPGGEYAAYTGAAVPYCLGDSYISGSDSFRVIGTTPDMFDKIAYGRNSDGSPIRYQFSSGRNFRRDYFFEGVIGSVVAHETGLRVGDTFHPAHGIVSAGDDAKIHEGFEVVGILEPTGTPNDRAMFVNMEGFYLLEGHARGEGVQPNPPPSESDAAHASDGHGSGGPYGKKHNRYLPPLPEEEREVTAVLVLLNMEILSQQIFRTINKGQVAQAVFPSQEISKLLEGIVRPMQLVLLMLTIMIVVVAGIGIMVSIYNSMSERRHEIAVMRALGAGRQTVLMVILLESILLSLLGGLAGILIGHGTMAVASPFLVSKTGVAINFLNFNPLEGAVLGGLIGLATVVGFVPALVAYKTEVSEALSATP